MSGMQLWFSSGEESLSPRRFSAHEGISSLFEVTVAARSPSDDIDLEALVGAPAAFRLARTLLGAEPSLRVWRGICSAAEQVHHEKSGLSTYEIKIVPVLWLLTQRANHRVFQHLSVPDIVSMLLDEWQIAHAWNVSTSSHPKLEYRVQYGETDFSFVSRLLDEAGITYVFSERDDGTTLSFFDAIEANESRPGTPLPWVDHPNEAAQREYVTDVRITRRVRPGKVTIRDFDFRRKPDFPLLSQASARSPHESRLEQYTFLPGSFLAEGGRASDTPAADDRGVARHQEHVGAARAERRLHAARVHKLRVSFATNVLDLNPGVIFSMGGHGHPDVGPDRRLLVTELSLEGSVDSEWRAQGNAVLAEAPYKPAPSAAKPVVHGVQSAVVVGPVGEEIHTDELGRVRVQFPWDREGGFDSGSSVWMRVSQGWAGGGFGMLALPRVGQEVLVGFFEGDPDQPVVVGRVFNNTTRVPYKLPEHRTKTTWRSASSPGADGFNELTFEDAKGRERVYLQAERDLESLVKHDEVLTVGRNRHTTVGDVDAAAIGTRHVVNIKGTSTGIEMVEGRITFTTGAATVTIDGPNITLDAGGTITLNAAADVVVNAAANVTVKGGATVTVASAGPTTVQAGGGDLVLQGGPMVSLNPGAGAPQATVPSSALDLRDLPVAVPPNVDLEQNIGAAQRWVGYDPERPTRFWDLVKPGGEWDYTRLGPQYEDFTAIHSGAVGAAAGFPLGVLLRQLGKVAIENGASTRDWGDPGDGVHDGHAPFGVRPDLSDLLIAAYEVVNASAVCTERRDATDELEYQSNNLTRYRRLSNSSGWHTYSNSTRGLLALRARPEEGVIEYVFWRQPQDTKPQHFGHMDMPTSASALDNTTVAAPLSSFLDQACLRELLAEQIGGGAK